MTPTHARVFFAAFGALSLAVTVNVMRHPPRTAAMVLAPPAKPAPQTQPAQTLPTGAPVAAAKPVLPPAAAPAAPTSVASAPAAATPSPATEPLKPQAAKPQAPKPQEPVVEATKTIVVGKEPVRVEARLPPARIVGQLPMPSVADGDHATVTAVQKALVDNGYGPLIVNGSAGPLTRAAIMSFEQTHSMALSGEASERLLKRLRGEAEGKSKRDPDAGKIVTQEAEHVVLIVQSSLQSLGHGPGKIDGRLGDDMDAAIRAFEADVNLVPSGRISATLFSRLARAVGAKSSSARE